MCRAYFIWNDTQVVPYGKGVAISLYTKGRFLGANRGDFCCLGRYLLAQAIWTECYFIEESFKKPSRQSALGAM